MKIKVIVVEDDPGIRERVVEAIQQSETCECIGDFESGEEAVVQIPKLKPDVVLMDIFLTGMTGIEAIAKIRPSSPGIQFLMCTVMEDNKNIFEALKAGATGYILKKTPHSGILAAIEELYKGGSPMSIEIARKVIASFQSHHVPESHDLSPREKEVLELLAQGYRYKKIAEKLFVSIDTVNTHIRHIYEKLQVNSKVEAIMKMRGGK